MLPYLDAGHKIPTYGLMLALAVLVCILLAVFLNKNSDIKALDRVYAISFALAGAVLGAKLLAIFTSLDYIINNRISLSNIITSGFVFYGGLIGGALGLFIYGKIYQIQILPLFDFICVILPLGQAIGRIGCFLAGCCFGRPTDSFLGVVYNTSADIHTPLGIPLLPVQLFESVFCLLLFAALMFLRNKNHSAGFLTAVYLIAYGTFRFINEFFRYDELRGFLGALSTSQIISIIVVLGGIFILLKNRRNFKTANSN